jgi:hypothetical protein
MKYKLFAVIVLALSSLSALALTGNSSCCTQGASCCSDGCCGK